MQAKTMKAADVLRVEGASLISLAMVVAVKDFLGLKSKTNQSKKSFPDTWKHKLSFHGPDHVTRGSKSNIRRSDQTFLFNSS